ncbi:bifunctional phosphopantothenoylcysteine decarboxylase/phosphopantothenate--cysteine ligase CoaBC [Paenibacillus wulumuqiensis]|uniref:bifunctional phosphopantothenoylcysteine decarboxylase/phosphopantothenate--cysteine ligase CoaBC n=1 Tax=Paenibacillus wulumuqiensis TaxID=1567107 RepID=UPI000619EE40|nr:bifunctional phosphopantothenoylcysteine decarboxylase/phosphopantothenate--cysteine ligase CoaBC [Paenibacillus wulumuqiensis]
MLRGKKIVLGITGGIAAYKAAALCSGLVKQGADVHVIMTDSASKFITELTLQTLSRNPVHIDTFDERNPEVVTHIHLADLADLVLIAPATANTISKMTLGLADDMLSSMLLATTAPIMIAPAMNVHMYQHPAIMQNMNTLVSRGVLMIEPGEGMLACGYVGKGRLEEPETIIRVVHDFFAAQQQREEMRHLMAGRKVTVTAGGTIERIDPVRYITNDSSGKMGIAVARAAYAMGADVRLIAGSVQVPLPEGIDTVRVQSAQDMYEAVIGEWSHTDIMVQTAAVADYRPKTVHATKMKKNDENLVLELEKTTDILESLGQRKNNQFLIGFAAETNNVAEYAMGKVIRKNCDLLVANDVTIAGAGFGTDTNKVQIYDAQGLVEDLPLMSKDDVAFRLLSIAASRLNGVSAS